MEKSSRPKRVAVIGAGPNGLVSMKSCKEEGMEVVCFEKSGNIGGLWYYHEEDIPGVPSVMSSTVTNSSKDMLAFSDFPPPEDFPNYMPHPFMLKYFHLYAEHFDLFPCLRLNHEVVTVRPAEDFKETGQWVVTARNVTDNTIIEDVFSAVMVCVGHHVFPNMPTFPGQDTFRGEILHSHSLKTVDKFKDKRVLVIGMGNSGIDVAVDSTNVTSQVYLSTRKGVWLVPRIGPHGVPYDAVFHSRTYDLFFHLFGYRVVSALFQRDLNKWFDHGALGIKPHNCILAHHPAVTDVLPIKVISGRIKIRRNVERFAENGVIFEGETEVTEVDVVVMATGYLIKFPFLNDEIIRVKDNCPDLYKNVFPPDLEHHTLAVIGLTQAPGSLIPIGEMQARWFVLHLSGKVQLPSPSDMWKDIKNRQRARAKRYISSSRHTIEEDWLPYMDSIASLIGVKPNLFKMVFTDPKLFWRCFAGPCVPAQFRLQGPHAWPGARDSILSWQRRYMSPLKTSSEANNN